MTPCRPEPGGGTVLPPGGGARGPGHGCGHNLLGTGAAAAAVALKEYLEQAGVSGTVRFYGCPAEESGCGKERLAQAGEFDGLDVCLTWHPGTRTMWSAAHTWPTSSSPPGFGEGHPMRRRPRSWAGAPWTPAS